MQFADGKAFAIEIQRAYMHFRKSRTRDAVRWLYQCLEGLRFIREKRSMGSLSILNWHDGRTVTILTLDQSPEGESIFASLQQMRSELQAFLRDDTEDFDLEYSTKGHYAKSRIWTTIHLLNPIDSQSYSVTHILPLEVRVRLGLE